MKEQTRGKRINPNIINKPIIFVDQNVRAGYSFTSVTDRLIRGKTLEPKCYKCGGKKMERNSFKSIHPLSS